MLVLDSHITIGDFQFDFVHKVSINSSWRDLTDTAIIELPRKIRFQDKDIRDLIRKGDPMSIQLGYDGELRDEFTGYVAGVMPDLPLTIRCEDLMWQLKQTNLKNSWASTTLQEVLEYIHARVFEQRGFTFGIQAIDISLGKLQIDNVSAAKVLDELKSKYGLRSYFQDNQLFVGIIYADSAPEVAYHFQENVIDTDLEYRRKDDIRIKVRAVSINPDGSKLEVELGDEDGEERTLHFFDLNEADLKGRAQEEIDRLKVDGYRGNIRTFGIPFVQHGHVATLIDDEFPERGGKNFIDKLTTEFGQDGFKRIVNLDKTAA